MGELTIRTARLSDAQALLDIYAPYVRDTAISFEYEVPTLESFTGRIQKTLEGYPYLVAEQDGAIVGYTYAGPLKNRDAYAWAVETTIYIRQGRHGRGCGRALYQALEEALARQNILNLYACIAYTNRTEDPYLTNASVDFHSHMGYGTIAHFHDCGYLFNQWYDMVWMEKLLGAHTPTPKPVLPFPET